MVGALHVVTATALPVATELGATALPVPTKSGATATADMATARIGPASESLAVKCAGAPCGVSGTFAVAGIERRWREPRKAPFDSLTKALAILDFRSLGRRT